MVTLKSMLRVVGEASHRSLVRHHSERCELCMMGLPSLGLSVRSESFQA